MAMTSPHPDLLDQLAALVDEAASILLQHRDDMLEGNVSDLRIRNDRDQIEKSQAKIAKLRAQIRQDKDREKRERERKRRHGSC